MEKQGIEEYKNEFETSIGWWVGGVQTRRDGAKDHCAPNARD